ncbi:MAG TPA: M15 family metallopeptidase [Flavisolibacter sp.]|nr:M15 family metallopeptidase [Flavisolibacter sp.]
MMQKIRFNVKLFCPIFLCLSVFATVSATAQELKVVRNAKEYKQLVEKDSLQQMVEINKWLSSASYELAYGTKNNFTGTRLYPKGKQTFVRISVARALQKVEQDLLLAGYDLKVWDAYRPYAVTKKMWELIGDERYVANPAKGSGHNRGLAIDLTMTKDGKEANMGTGFDNFSDTAHHAFNDLPEEVLQNRKLLRTTMEKHGFKALETEWWHYSWPNDRQYEVMDLPFKKLQKTVQ